MMLLVMMLTAQTARAAEYEISSLEELREFMEAVHVEDFAGDVIRLTKDIDCECGRFNTGDPEYPSTFRGTFDGQGHKIYNFVHTPTGSGDEGYGTAMFDFAETGATIQNLTLEGSLPGDIYCGAYAAAFVLAVESPLGLLLDNCHFNGSVTNVYHSAALVGFANPGAGVPSITLNKCSANANITTTSNNIAGGLVAKGTGVKAYDCSFTGTISGKWTMGGLIGVAVNCTFTDCSFNGSMGEGPGTSTSILSNGGCGGLVGYSDGSVFTRCTATVTINWDLNSGGTERTSSNNFVGEGGAAGVTLGASKFVNCSATGTLTAAHGYAGGFVGWTAGAETFDHCTTDVKINADARHNNVVGNGGFAACVASDGATFVDCTTSSQGNDIYGGFYNVQHPKSDVTVGANTFLRCTVNNVSVFGDGSNATTGGFCVSAWNGTFTDCTVRGGKPEAGFVLIAGKKPSSDYENGQTSTFTNCAVVGATVTTGFVGTTNPDNSSTNINKFKGCRASCTYYNLCNGSSYNGFAHTLRNKTTVEDCAAYGAQAGRSDELYGFAYEIEPGATVSRCVGAVLPLASTKYVAGFAGTISYGTAVENCYSVYTARSACAESNINGTQGGFVRQTSIGYNSNDLPIARCFALGVVPAGSDAGESAGSFCGVTPYSMSTHYFVDCWRPAESQVRDVGNIGNDAGVGDLTATQFSNTTAATMPNYDFANTWKAPRGDASSPYLAASTDKDGNFWVFTAVTSGKGHILINGEEPKEAYAPGSVLTVKAVTDDPDAPFTGWVGEGFDDPTKQTTTYKVRNVCVIAATFGTPIRTCDDLAAIAINPSGTYFITKDIDLAGENWTPLCQDINSPFTGKLYGGDHVIKNMTVDTNGGNYVGLFGCLGGATVSSITFENASVTGRDYVAALAGFMKDGTTISGITFTGTNSIVCGNYVGGIVGYNYGGTISSCDVPVSVTIQATANNTDYHGGIVGYNNGSSCIVENCTSAATLTIGDGLTGCDYYGGIVGYNDGTLRNNLAIGATVPAANSGYGAITGYTSNNNQLANNYYRNCTVAGVENATGVGCQNADVTANGGAASIHSLTLGTGITTTAPVSITIGSTDYYAYGTDIPLSGGLDGLGDSPAGYTSGYATTVGFIGYTQANGYTLTMPAADATVTASNLFPIDWAEEGNSGDDADNAYLIYNKDQLDLLARRVNGTDGFTATNYQNKYFKLMSDIAYTHLADGEAGADTENNFTPISGYVKNGTSYTTRFFKGHFLGQGHSISGIRIYRNGNTKGDGYLGLFGYPSSGAEVNGVTLIDARITGYDHVGGIVGHSYSNTLTNNLAVNVTVTYTNNGDYGGIIAGYISGSTLSNNFYSDCTLNKTYNGTTATTDIGCKHADVTANNGAIGAIALYDQGTDNAKIISDNANESRNVALVGHTLYKDGKWNTLCLPFSIEDMDIDDTPLAGAKLMSLANVNSNTGFDSSTGTLTLDFVEAGEIDAGVAYIVKWETTGDPIVNPVFKGVTITTDTPADQKTTSQDEKVSFVGTYDQKTYTDEDKSVLFLGDGNTLYYPSGSNPTTIGACRAYFQLNGITASESSSGVRAFALNFGDDTTGIENVQSSMLNVQSNNVWYGLDGRKLEIKPTRKGLYIHNGAVVVIK